MSVGQLICQYTEYSGSHNRVCYKRINTGQVDRRDGGKGDLAKRRSLDDIESPHDCLSRKLA